MNIRNIFRKIGQFLFTFDLLLKIKIHERKNRFQPFQEFTCPTICPQCGGELKKVCTIWREVKLTKKLQKWSTTSELFPEKFSIIHYKDPEYEDNGANLICTQCKLKLSWLRPTNKILLLHKNPLEAGTCERTIIKYLDETQEIHEKYYPGGPEMIIKIDEFGKSKVIKKEFPPPVSVSDI